MGAESGEPSGRRSNLWRNLALAGLAGAAGAVTAGLWLRQRRRRRPRQASPRGGGDAPALPDEVRKALEWEALDENAEVPTDELLDDFTRAAAWASSDSGGSLSTDGKLALYGAYKQLVQGDAPDKRPWGIEASMKWDAWRRLLGTSRAQAMRQYVVALDGLAPRWRSGGDAEAAPSKAKADGSSGMGFAVSTMGRIGDPDQNDDVDESAVGQLCEKIADGDVEAARAILRRQPKLALEPDKDGMLPLHWAADRGELEVAKLLIEIARKFPGGASDCLNAKDGCGDTPLHYAVNTDNVELVRLLVDAGADPEAANEDGETALALAEGQDELEAALLGAPGAQPKASPRTAETAAALAAATGGVFSGIFGD